MSEPQYDPPIRAIVIPDVKAPEPDKPKRRNTHPSDYVTPAKKKKPKIPQAPPPAPRLRPKPKDLTHIEVLLLEESRDKLVAEMCGPKPEKKKEVYNEKDYSVPAQRKKHPNVEIADVGGVKAGISEEDGTTSVTIDGVTLEFNDSDLEEDDV